RRSHSNLPCGVMKVGDLPQHRDPGEADTDALELLATALAGYLEEVKECCSICLEYETTTTVSVSGTALALTRHFPWASETVRSVCRVAEDLPGWQESLFWKAERHAWTE